MLYCPSVKHTTQQEGLAVASIARDDPSTLPGNDCLAKKHSWLTLTTRILHLSVGITEATESKAHTQFTPALKCIQISQVSEQ